MFWEAQSVILVGLNLILWIYGSEYITPISPPSLPVLAMAEEDRLAIFNPAEASLDDRNSILVATQQITTYLDKRLTHLKLHTEARTSFIT